VNHLGIFQTYLRLRAVRPRGGRLFSLPGLHLTASPLHINTINFNPFRRPAAMSDTDLHKGGGSQADPMVLDSDSSDSSRQQKATTPPPPKRERLSMPAQGFFALFSRGDAVAASLGESRGAAAAIKARALASQGRSLSTPFSNENRPLSQSPAPVPETLTAARVRSQEEIDMNTLPGFGQLAPAPTPSEMRSSRELDKTPAPNIARKQSNSHRDPASASAESSTSSSHQQAPTPAPVPAAAAPATGNISQKRRANGPRRATTRRRSPKDRKRPQYGTETFSPHPTDPSLLVARYRYTDPAGRLYEQTDNIPVHDKTKTSQTPPQYVFYPKLATGHIPPRNRTSKAGAIEWVKNPNGNDWDNWTRAREDGREDELWRPIALHRRMDANTGEYIETYLRPGMKDLVDVDPNNKRYKDGVNSRIEQIKRRLDSEWINTVRKDRKDHWVPAERRALMGAINAFVAKRGVHNFGIGTGIGMIGDDLKAMATAVSSAEGSTMTRTKDGVRSQIQSSHAKKNSGIRRLLDHANVVRDRIENGEKVNKKDLYPAEAIPKDTWPGIQKKKKKNKEQGKRKFSKYDLMLKDDDEEFSVLETPRDDEELSDPETSEGRPPPVEMAAAPTSAQKSRKRKFVKEAETNDQDEEWTDTDDEIRESDFEESEWRGGKP
jgi:hypothetical protein